MVDLIPIKRLYQYENLKRVDSSEGRRYVGSNANPLPSVTTILSSTKDKAGLNEWVARVGESEADRIKSEAAAVGTHMHAVIEMVDLIPINAFKVFILI